MESFWFDTPVGLALIASALATLASVIVILLRSVQYIGSMTARSGADWIQLCTHFLMYVAILPLLSYGHLVLFTLAAYLLPDPMFSIAPSAILLLWIVSARWLFCHLCGPWLPMGG